MGFISKLFGGGSSATTDRKSTLTGYGDLQNAFNFGMDQSKSQAATGTATTAKGVADLQDPLKYYKTLLSGDRTAMQGAIAPEANATQAAADAARRNSAAVGTARGGGTAGQAQTAKDSTQATLDNYLFGVRPGAAAGVSDIAKTEADIGTKEVGEALGFGSLAEGAASDLTKDSIASRKDSYAINQQTTQQVASVVGNILAGFGI
jgi:hypothetical protein